MGVGEEFWVGEMAWMTVPSRPRSQLHAYFHVLGLEVVPEWVKWHGWQCQAVQDPIYMPNSTFWGWRWCRIAMWTCYTALTVSLHCVDDLSTIQDRWGKSSEWVKWHGWQYQAIQDPTYMTNSMFWGWRWCRIAMQTCYSALTVSIHCLDDLSTIQDGWGVLSGWNGMDDSAKPTEIPLTYLIPRFGVIGGVV